MLSRIAPCILLLLLLLGNSPSTAADNLAEFNAAVEAAGAHNRIAIGYLRTGNLDLASLEIDRLRNAWARLTERFSGNRPAAFKGNPHYASLFTGVSARLVGADLMLKTGRPDAARSGLDAIRRDLYELRRDSGVFVLADCVRDANAAMDELMVFDGDEIDWVRAAAAGGLASKSAAYASILNQCDEIAGDRVRNASEFRRLIDGAKSSLALISKAIAEHDGGLLHRVLIELRSFANLLDFRFG
ncbi:MAG TPA: hypothetical protein VFP60_18920 [Pseudolabrys sp.]|nr:hypothetical protein [Pseudolabrys sp.]